MEPLEKLGAGSSGSNSSSGSNRRAANELSVALVITKSGLLQALLQQLTQLRSDTSHVQLSTHSDNPLEDPPAASSDVPASSSGVSREGQVSAIGSVWQCQCCQRRLSLRPEATFQAPPLTVSSSH